MRIDSLQINHYKSIEHPLLLQNFSNLNIFVGQTNSGKTNIFDAVEFLLLKKTGARHDDPEADMNITVTLDDTEQHNIHQALGGKIAATYQVAAHDGALANKEILWEQFFSSHVVRLGKDRVYQEEKQYLELFGDLNKNHPEAARGFQEEIQKHFPEIRLDALPETLNEYGQERLLERLGDGFRQFFIILLYLYHPVHRIVFIDEVEMNLHPGLLKKLIRSLRNQSLHNQIFLTTNSTLLVHPELLPHLYRVVRDQQKKSTVVYSLAGAKHGFHGERLRQELDSDNSEMFFADKVLLVEGVSDRIFMRDLINKFYKGENDVKVVHVSGKDNVDVYIELLRVFHIPYVVLLDRDALGDRGIRAIQNIVEKQTGSAEKHLAALQKADIFVLPNGAIENNYPRRFRGCRSTKPLCALSAGANITEQEFQAHEMRHLRQVIEAL